MVEKLTHDATPSVVGCLTGDKKAGCEAGDEGTSLSQFLRKQFSQELLPIGIAEKAVVAAIACRAATLHAMAERARVAQENLRSGEFDADVGGSTIISAGIALAAAKQVDRTAKRFDRELRLLLDLQVRRMNCSHTIDPPAPFKFDGNCIEYLVRWKTAHFRCRVCGARKSYHIRKRRCLECATPGCKSQTGLRAGTVMERSRTSLAVWFRAISLVLQSPAIRPQELQLVLKLRRYATARSLTTKIIAAMISDQRSELLAGLDRIFQTPTAK